MSAGLRHTRISNWQYLLMMINWEVRTPPMPTRNVNLTDHFDQFIETSVASGRFSNASELVREGLRLLEQREQENQAKLEWLRSAVQLGIDDIESGDYTEIRSGRDLDAFMREIREETSAELKAKQARG